MISKYYSRLTSPPNQTQRGRKGYPQWNVKNIPHLIKNNLHVNCLQYGFVMYNDEVIIFKREVIPLIPDSMIPAYFYENYH